MQVPNETGPGVRRSKRPLLASRNRCRSVLTSKYHARRCHWDHLPAAWPHPQSFRSRWEHVRKTAVKANTCRSQGFLGRNFHSCLVTDHCSPDVHFVYSTLITEVSCGVCPESLGPTQSPTNPRVITGKTHKQHPTDNYYVRNPRCVILMNNLITELLQCLQHCQATNKIIMFYKIIHP